MVRKSTLMQITSIREEENMKTMKKAISALLLVCMVSALCSAGAYATDETTEASFSFTVDKTNPSSTEQVTATPVFSGITDPSAFTVTWSWNDGAKTYSASGTSKPTRNATEFGTGTTISATATDGTTTLTAPDVKVTVVDPSTDVLTASVSQDGNKLTAHAYINGSEVTPNEVSWTCSGDISIASASGSEATIQSSDNYKDVTSDITASVTYQDKTVNVTFKATLPATSFYVTKINITSPTSVSVNGQITLTATVEPENATNKNLTWSSDDTDIVTISNNILTGKKPGSATITATAKDDSRVSATYTITVSPVAVESVTLNKTAASIPAGSSETLIATVTPDNAADKTVTWTSSDVSVATVDSNGKVTAIKEGTATITAATANGKSATCTVTVTKPASVRVDISSSIANNTITARGGKIAVYANVYKDNQLVKNVKVNWSVTKATASNGLTGLTDYGYYNNAWTAVVTGNFNGDYEMTATCVIDNVTYSATLPIKVAYAPSIVAGNYSVWNGKDPLSFLINDHISNWNGRVWIDGTEVSSNFYTCIGSSDGEIWLTLSPSLLSMVNQYNSNNSTHTLVVGDSKASAPTGYFRTWGTASSFNGVKTGDDANLGLWAALLIVSAIGVGSAVVICKRRKDSKG